MLRQAVLKVVVSTTLILMTSSSSNAAGPEPVKLWANGAPGQQGKEDHDVPLIRIYPAGDDATGTAVVILPGGGYGGLAMDHEGHQIAKWWNRLGVTGLVVTYRHAPHYQHPAPLQDAQRAIRYVRANAKELGIDPHRVGIMGFSAGGHLASTVSTHFDDGDETSEDVIAQQGSRPDFSVLCYPVISMSEPLTHKGSRRNLLGKAPSEELVESLSNQLQVTTETPPTFIFHTAEDQAVPVGGSVLYYNALIENGVDAELHIYQKGRHGVGLAPNDPVLKSWPDRLADWMRTNNFLTGKKRVSVSGKVEVGGEPLKWGLVAFTSRDSDKVPAVATMVSGGKYSIPKEDGPVAGDYFVSVYTMGTFARTPSIEDAVSLTGGDAVPGLFTKIIDRIDNKIEIELPSQ